MLSREEVLKLAKEAGFGALTDYGEVVVEKFAALVAAQYEQDARRYRWLRDNKFKHNGHCLALTGSILWEDTLDAAVDAAMEQTK